jgi:hypothetical protein
MNKKFVSPTGAVYTHPTNNDPYAQSHVLKENDIFVDESYWLCDEENGIMYLKSVDDFVRLTKDDEVDPWNPQKMVLFGTEYKTMASYNFATKELIIHEEFSTDDRSHHRNHVSQALKFAMKVLFEKNKFVYELITNISNTPNSMSVYKLTDGIFKLIQEPKRMTVIETMAKANSPKMAVTSILTGVEIGSGKRAAILPKDLIEAIRVLKLDKSLATFQRMVQDNVLSVNQVEELLQGLKYLIKFKFITYSELDAVISRYEDTLVNKRINLSVVVDCTLKSFLNLYDVSGKTNEYNYRRSYYYYNEQTFKKLMSVYIDAIAMLPDDKIANPTWYRTNDVERYHVITVRNSKLMQNPREEEFAAATERLRKMKWENNEYIFRPFKDEEELFFVGQQYNNCLPIYRDKIIDGAVLVCAFKKTAAGNEEDCPDFVIEFTPRLDVLEASTYNNVDISDADRLQVLRDYIDSRRYLLSNGRTVFREPDPKEKASQVN